MHRLFLSLLMLGILAVSLSARENSDTVPLTVQGTRDLIASANSSDPGKSLAAAIELVERLPDPREGMTNDGFLNAHIQNRNVRAAKSWDKMQTKEIHALGIKFLSRNEDAAVGAGAEMIQSAGTAADMPLLFHAVIQQSPYFPRKELPNYPVTYPVPLDQLLWAIRVLDKRGYDSSHPTNQIEALAYFLSFAGHEGTRSPEWYRYMETYSNSPHYPICLTSLESIPLPLQDNCVKFVQAGLENDDAGVCLAACDIAEYSGRKEFLKPILAVLASEDDELLLGTAHYAADQLGGSYEDMLISANRLPGRQGWEELAYLLRRTFSGLPDEMQQGAVPNRTERMALQAAWQKFLALHADELRQGKQIPYTDPSVTTTLVGQCYWWKLPGDKTWPSPHGSSH